MLRPTVMITGAARRLGAATALAFAQRGCNLAIHYHGSAKEAQLLQQSLEHLSVDCLLMSADLRVVNDVAGLVHACIDRFGQLDHQVNNASVFFPTPLETTSLNELLDTLQVNYMAPKMLMESAREFLANTDGSITNLIDIYADAGLANHEFYVASKAALKALTLQQAKFLAPKIRVNGVSPGAILWPDSPNDNSQANDTSVNEADLQRQTILEHSALKRLGQPASIAATIVYLALDAKYTTGSIIRVDGGRRDYI
jgi:pteridine reductase